MCLRRTVFEMRGDGVRASHDIRGTIPWMNGERHEPLRGVFGVGEGSCHFSNWRTGRYTADLPRSRHKRTANQETSFLDSLVFILPRVSPLLPFLRHGASGFEPLHIGARGCAFPSSSEMQLGAERKMKIDDVFIRYGVVNSQTSAVSLGRNQPHRTPELV